jgi:hypothetical protein
MEPAELGRCHPDSPFRATDWRWRSDQRLARAARFQRAAQAGSRAPAPPGPRIRIEPDQAVPERYRALAGWVRPSLAE